MHLDTHTRPWEHVTPVKFCPACRGTPPPDSYAACSTCGGGIQPPRVWQEIAEEHVTVPQPTVPLAELVEDARRRRSWATWPNITVEVDNPPPPDPSWPARDVAELVTAPRQIVTMRQATFTPTGGPYYPPPPRRWRIVRPVPAPRRSWWRRIWRRRRG